MHQRTMQTISPNSRNKQFSKNEKVFLRVKQEFLFPRTINKQTTLSDFAAVWKTDWADQHLLPRTVEGYMQELEGKILPVLGHIKLCNLRPVVVNRFFVSLTKDGARKDNSSGGYSKSSIEKTFNVLSSVLHVAVDFEIIESNPCNRIRLSFAEPKEPKINYFTPEQAMRFLDYLDESYEISTKGHHRKDDTGIAYRVPDYVSTRSLPEQSRILLMLALYSGLRKGEILALHWSDIDFETSEVNVTKAISMVAGKPVCQAPKTHSGIRTVAIPPDLTERLASMRKNRTEYIKSHPDKWEGAEDWIFVQKNGNLMNYCTPNHLLNDVIDRYNKDENHPEKLPSISFHGLRHTSATLLIHGNQDVKTVQSRLGHAEASTTMNIYAHALQKNDRSACNALEQLLKNHH